MIRTPLFDRRLFTFAAGASALSACARPTTAAGPLPDDMSLGDPNAPITFVEYASCACPVCGRWFKEVYPAFKIKYIDSGKVHFIYREMLVGSGVEVSAAAAGFLLARCAGKDRYFSIVDAVYDSQPSLFEDPRGVLMGIGKAAGFSEDKFNACVNDTAALKALSARVEANSKKDNVTSTPTFVINGQSLEAGYHPLADIDAAIAAAKPAKA